MGLKCIKCKNLALDKDKYPCNSCKEIDCINRMISHFVDRNYRNKRYKEWESLDRKNKNQFK